MSTAPSKADAPRPWARAIMHARIPASLKLLLLALFAAFSRADTTGHTLRTLRKDWLFSTNTDFADDLDSAQNPYALRRLLQLRAEIGWLLRGTPNRGMALSGHRAPALCPPPSARAPPWPAHALIHLESVAKTPLPAAMTHARSMSPIAAGSKIKPPSSRATPQSPPRRNQARPGSHPCAHPAPAWCCAPPTSTGSC